MTNRSQKSRHDPSNAQARATLISKALSRLLRHAAAQEKISIDALGYVRLDHLLAWRGLGKFVPRVESEEVFEAVRESEKARFGLLYRGRVDERAVETGGEVVGQVEGEVRDGVAKLAVGDEALEEVDAQSQSQPQQTDTQRALEVWDAGKDTQLQHYFIRANQGHSMTGVASEGLLTPITLEAGNVPSTVVHGTFYGAWERILAEGKIKAMGRNHAHFSTGPSVDVARTAGGDESSAADGAPGKGKRQGSRLAKMMEGAKVVSGMRKDAEVLIYVDVEKALAKGMSWWLSENGVVLTEGLGEEGVGVEFWIEVVEVREGLGSLWRDGQMVLDLPERLKGRPLPMGKGGRGGQRGRGGGGGRGAGARGGRGDRDGRSRIDMGAYGGHEEL
jgi:RNA:NAD 2'-phosphotransferase (TPT1/KptA family)